GSPTHHRQETGAFAHVECAYTLGTVDLMSREREQIYSQVVDVERQLPRGLHSVHMQQDTALSGHLAKGGGRLNRPDFMISEANTDQHSFWSQRCGQVLYLDSSFMIYGKDGHCESFAGEQTQWFQDQRMLDRSSDSVPSFTACRPQRSAQSQIVAFGATAGEQHFGGARLNECGHSLPCFF